VKTKRPPASDAVRREWLRRVEAEYRSAAITQHLGLWLIQIGASPDLVRRAMRIAADEIAHAEMSHRTYVAAGGRDLPAIVRESLALVRHEDDPLEHDVARVAVEVFCLGETVAVPLFKALREGCTVPVARRALDRVLRDEVRHRDFGWTLLAWLMEHPDAPAMRALIEAELATWFARLSASYAPEPKGEREPPVRDDDRAWGLMPLASYRAAVDKTFARDWEPRFAKLGFDAQKAWSRCTGA
jgi:hypothetical protein